MRFRFKSLAGLGIRNLVVEKKMGEEKHSERALSDNYLDLQGLGVSNAFAEVKDCS